MNTFNDARTIKSTNRARRDSNSSSLDEQPLLTCTDPQILKSCRRPVKDMATARKTPVGAAAAVLLLLIAAGALASASASALTLHLKQGCIQPKSASCGVCYNIGPVFKGYYFNYYGARPPCSTTGSTAKAATTSSAGTSAAARPPADIKAFSYHATRELSTKLASS
ncbi:unnamed protein product [Spirodela intermedia]|uniref:Uncharacterized protein n=1 Tax=Spirodela intermedia TaxID=51605 RepID=A0A7I8IJQ8_SPIIN|nr:unnamed protein product [Spirodela intermedia]CAA6658116.1 unnamed protein product [Spirodela intermedia]